MTDEQSLVFTGYAGRNLHIRSQTWERVLDVAIEVHSQEVTFRSGELRDAYRAGLNSPEFTLLCCTGSRRMPLMYAIVGLTELT